MSTSMSREELLAFFDASVASMREILSNKNHDYAGKNVVSDAFFNFTRVDALGISSTETGFLTRMTDKLCRIITFVKGGVLMVDDEKVSDTLLDLANYSILMAGYIKAKRANIEGIAEKFDAIDMTYTTKKAKKRGHK